MIYALDSDIISYMLKGDRDVQSNFNDLIDNNNFYSIPPLVYYEIKRGLTTKKAYRKLQDFSDLYSDSIKGEMTLEVWQKAVEIYCRLKSQGRIIGDGDIFIAAFCLINDYVLVTNNIKHFGNIEELKITTLVD